MGELSRPQPDAICARNELLANASPVSQDAVLKAVERARKAQPSWAALSFGERSKCLRRFAQRLRTDEPLHQLISTETGKPVFEAFGFEVGYTLEIIRYLTGRAGRNVLHEHCGRPFVFPWKRTRIRYRPRGVVAVIGPWNFPLQNNFGDSVAPLLAGNAVILKPSPFTPATSRRVEMLWKEACLPADVFQIVEGEGDVGRALIGHSDMVFFTGSVRVGREVARQAGERLIPCVTELGGKSVLIVTENADLEAASTAAVWGAFANAGQICIRPERILVVQAVADDFVARVLEKTKKLRLGHDPTKVDLGPLMTEGQIARVREQLQEAIDHGATIRCGFTPDSVVENRLFPPTIVDGVPFDVRLAQEESFAPVMCIIRVRDEEEALSVSNDSLYGLSGYVFSRNINQARALARRLNVGSVCINDVLVNYHCSNAPLGGWKNSGLGFRNSALALLQFCYPQTLVEDRNFTGWISNLAHRQLAFPYRPKMVRFLRTLMKLLYP